MTWDEWRVIVFPFPRFELARFIFAVPFEPPLSKHRGFPVRAWQQDGIHCKTDGSGIPLEIRTHRSLMEGHVGTSTNLVRRNLKLKFVRANAGLGEFKSWFSGSFISPWKKKIRVDIKTDVHTYKMHRYVFWAYIHVLQKISGGKKKLSNQRLVERVIFLLVQSLLRSLYSYNLTFQNRSEVEKIYTFLYRFHFVERNSPNCPFSEPNIQFKSTNFSDSISSLRTTQSRSQLRHSRSVSGLSSEFREPVLGSIYRYVWVIFPGEIRKLIIRFSQFLIMHLLVRSFI